MTSSNLKMLSYNCRGWNTGSNFLDSQFLLNYDICLIQEHWLLTEQLSTLNINSQFCSFGVSVMDSSRLLRGRPFGGCGFFFGNLFFHSLLDCSQTLPDSVHSASALIPL